MGYAWDEVEKRVGRRAAVTAMGRAGKRAGSAQGRQKRSRKDKQNAREIFLVGILSRTEAYCKMLAWEVIVPTFESMRA